MEYERFADIYGVWTATAPSAQANLRYYVDAYLDAPEGAVVELGVGDGRIAVEAARAGRAVTGVDLSPAMLRLCAARAAETGVGDRITLLQADFRTFSLPAPAALIALPYHSLGHLVSIDDKRAALRHIYDQLQPGGRFLFDDFMVTPDAIDRMRRVQLRAEYATRDGQQVLLWVTSLVDTAAQTIRCITWEDIVAADGVLQTRTYRTLSLSWLEPDQARALLEETGFVVEACYGSFTRDHFDVATAGEQVWVARKPNGGR